MPLAKCWRRRRQAMDKAEARAVLVEMLGEDAVKPDDLDCHDPYVSASMEDGIVCGVTLDASFSADQLEAIAAWMRDPKGVAGAEQTPPGPTYPTDDGAAAYGWVSRASEHKLVGIPWPKWSQPLAEGVEIRELDQNRPGDGAPLRGSVTYGGKDDKPHAVRAYSWTHPEGKDMPLGEDDPKGVAG